MFLLGLLFGKLALPVCGIVRCRLTSGACLFVFVCDVFVVCLLVAWVCVFSYGCLC